MNRTAPLRIEGPAPGQMHLIEANAGTGKTYAIANLFLRFVLEGYRVRQLLVVTFTRAATDELRGRIRARLVEATRLLKTGVLTKDSDEYFKHILEKLPRGEERDVARRRLDLALLEINEANIHTIHGFCQQTLGDRAFSSGQAFDLEQADDRELRRRAVHDWWRRRTYTLEPAALAVFRHLFDSVEALTRQLAPLLDVPAPEPCPSPPEGGAQPPDDELQARLRELADAWREQHDQARALLLAPASPLNRNRHRPATLARRLDELDASLLETPLGLPADEALKAVSRDAFTFRKGATDEDLTPFELSAFRLAARLREALATRSGALRVAELEAARRYVQTQTRLAKQRLGQLAFDDMILHLHQALHGGGDLARDLAAALPVIMVDEFQDTDPLQYAIFRRIHQAGRDRGQRLILIGDPKQAIYGFRGGDIFTYMRARQAADRLWSLATNWRSTPAMIEAVNALFDGPKPFAYDEIPYQPSRPPSGGARARPLHVDGRERPALCVEDLPKEADGSPMGNRDALEARIHEAVAAHIAALLQPGAARLGDDKLQPADIAVLVTTHRQGQALREALQRRGVRAVTAGRESIWQTAEASGLQRLLEAALLPGDRRLARQALAEDMLNLHYPEIQALIGDMRRWGQWVEMLAACGEAWRRHGLMAGVQRLLQGLSRTLAPRDDEGRADPAGWLARLPDPERTLTNLLHLADLLQAASREHAAGEHLLAWMRRQRETVAGEEQELRLESDEDLVKILTIHKSKGLQFPVVFVPYLWSAKGPPGRAEPLSWHQEADEDYRHHYAPGGCEEGRIPAAREGLAEALRLAYVALTRAESHCHLYLGAGGRHAGRSALAWLISARDTDLEREFFELDAADLSPRALEGLPGIETRPFRPPPDALRLSPPAADPGKLAAGAIRRRVRDNWRIGSFSAMSRDVHQATRAPAASGSEGFALRYPAGADVGSFLHALLERLDPRADLQPQIERLAPWLFQRHGIRPDPLARDTAGLAAWMHDVLHTPLDDQGLTLAALDTTQRELAFDLGAGPVSAGRLDAVLRAGREETLPPLNFEDFQGMLTGVIDLVFEHRGRYYLADYKSNLLGRNLADYAPPRLAAEIASRRYDLQYLLYTLALHRHLGQRLPDYDYRRHIGGVYYLFLRGMRPRSGPTHGVFFTRPDAGLIEALDRQLIGRPGEAGA